MLVASHPTPLRGVPVRAAQPCPTPAPIGPPSAQCSPLPLYVAPFQSQEACLVICRGDELPTQSLLPIKSPPSPACLPFILSGGTVATPPPSEDPIPCLGQCLPREPRGLPGTGAKHSPTWAGRRGQVVPRVEPRTCDPEPERERGRDDKAVPQGTSPACVPPTQ